jgi:hypothetical protein
VARKNISHLAAADIAMAAEPGLPPPSPPSTLPGVGGRWPVSGEVAYLLGPPERHTDSRGAPNDAYLAVNESTAPHAKTTSDLAQINKVGVPNVIATAVLSNVGDAEESVPEPRIQASLHVFHSRSLMLTSSFGAACFKASLGSVS